MAPATLWAVRRVSPRSLPVSLQQQHAQASKQTPTSSTLPASPLSSLTSLQPPRHPPPRLPGPPSYLHPEELELLKPTLVPSSAAGKQAPGGGGAADSSAASATKDKAAADAAAAAEEKVTLVPSSKKEAAVRRRELLAYLREPLREACASNAGELMRSKFAGALVLLETVRVSGLTLSSVVLCSRVFRGNIALLAASLFNRIGAGVVCIST